MRGMSEDIAGNKKVMAYKYYYKNGNIESEVVFVDNKKHGVEKTYFEDGKLKESITWVNGVQEGETKSYDDDGGYFTGSYKNGKFDGLWKGFYPDGSPKVENLWQEGRLIEVRFYNSPTGTPLDKGTLINGSGTRKTYNNQGKLESIITYEEGKFVSEYNVD
jgi:antitoxin component YwqK of YwqJK toxin-antitoxin module